MTTPTIFLVGERDVRVPMPQSIEMYRALRSNGVPTHLYVAPREPHGWRELRHRLYKANTWETAPDREPDESATATADRSEETEPPEQT